MSPRYLRFDLRIATEMGGIDAVEVISWSVNPIRHKSFVNIITTIMISAWVSNKLMLVKASVSDFVIFDTGILYDGEVFVGHGHN